MRPLRFMSLVSLLWIAIAACVGEEPLLTNPASDGDAGPNDTDAIAPDVSAPDSLSPSDDAATATDSADAGARGVVFVTTAQVTGAFAVDAGSPWGAADAICADEAKAAGLGGTYVAWLSYQNVAGTKFNAASRIGEMPYFLPAGEDGSAPLLFTSGKLALLTSGSGVSLARTATGAYVDQDENPAVAWVWTGTSETGVVVTSNSTCANWTSADSSEVGGAGNARRSPLPEPGDWTKLGGGRPCDEPRRLYCFQRM